MQSKSHKKPQKLSYQSYPLYRQGKKTSPGRMCLIQGLHDLTEPDLKHKCYDSKYTLIF